MSVALANGCCPKLVACAVSVAVSPRIQSLADHFNCCRRDLTSGEHSRDLGRVVRSVFEATHMLIRLSAGFKRLADSLAGSILFWSCVNFVLQSLQTKMK